MHAHQGGAAGRRRRAVAVALVAATILSVAPFLSANAVTPASAAEVTKPAGLVTDLTWYISRSDMDRSIALMREAGVKWVRANVNWSSVEPTAKGALDQWWLTEIDYAVNAATAAGIQVLMPISDGVPYWASADPQKHQDASGTHWNRYWKPASFTDYADFARAIVTRYQALGVHTFEVWNEPNYVRFWPSGPSATDYTSMLKAAYPAIKQADPTARVVLGGLSLNDYEFLQQLYTAGAAPFFDIAAVHPYTGSIDPEQCWMKAGTTRLAKEAFCGIAEVRNTMLANGDSSDIWLTEFGWSTAPVTNGVTEATQASYLTKAFNLITTYPYVTNAFWYSGRNNYWQADAQTDLEANYGLMKVNFALKPSFAAYKAWAAAPVATTTTTADTEAPVITAVAATAVMTKTATVSWTTNEASTSIVRYWVRGSSTVRTGSASGRVLAHVVKLSGLQRSTTYDFTVTSTDAAGNTRVSPVATFRTRL